MEPLGNEQTLPYVLRVGLRCESMLHFRMLGSLFSMEVASIESEVRLKKAESGPLLG